MTVPSIPKRVQEFLDLLGPLLALINQSASRVDFMERVSKVLVDTLSCDVVELRVLEQNKFLQTVTEANATPHFHAAVAPCATGPNGHPLPALADDSTLETTLAEIFSGKRAGGIMNLPDKPPGTRLVLPLRAGDRSLGLLCLADKQPDFFTSVDAVEFTALAQVLASALAHQRTVAALRERVKELTGLYEIMNVVNKTGTSLADALKQIPDHVAAAWRYPEIASCRLVVDDVEYRSSSFAEPAYVMREPIILNNRARGSLEVMYSEARPQRDEGPFLSEERHLIGAIVGQIAVILKNKEREQERADMEAQLHRADRLATIGQLAAGMAHEINEPLASILGFAQLALKDEALGDQTRRDVARIRDAALHSREVVKKLLFFGRQLPPQKTAVDIPHIVADVLGILQHRFEKAGVVVQQNFDPDVPELVADPGQLTQVMMNLLVNALQAMPEGGTVRLGLEPKGDHLCLTVADNGLGMDEAVRSQAFLPFFTTKNIDQGTGLGLAVVHGIIQAHGGTIDVESRPGQGTRFVMMLPLINGYDQPGEERDQ
ncbi:MAG: ATP-binding protein [Candidatus Lernaella stagnicola]|nr:ATP-binding protein [Candidatus Lernaella stagnicola]